MNQNENVATKVPHQNWY